LRPRLPQTAPWWRMWRVNPWELVDTDGYAALRATLGASFDKRRVLITGATGFLGPHVVAAGLALGADIHTFSASGSVPGVTSWAVRIEDRQAVAEAVACIRPKAVLHLAAAGVTYGTSAIGELLNVNVNGLDCLLSAVSEAGGCPFIVAGSGFEYAPREHAIAETDEIGPVSAYGVSKAAASLTASLYASRMPLTLLRIFNVFGAGEGDSHVLPYVVGRTQLGLPTDLTPGGQIRDYVYAGDVAECFWRVLATPWASGRMRVLNVGSGSSITLRELVELIGEELSDRGRAPRLAFGARPYRSNEVMYFAPRVDCLCRTLGWLPNGDIRLNIGRTIDWFLSNDRS